jgi:predicted dehydrogenase
VTAPLRVAVLGVGRFGERHVRAYARQPGVTVVAVADRDGVRARTVAERFGIAQWFEDGERLLDECRPDGVSVVTPGRDHLPSTLAALARGCCVLLEKPVAMSSEDVGEMQKAAGASAGFVMPAHILRFAAPYVALRTRVGDGSIGRLLGIAAVRDRDRGHVTLYGDVHPALMTLVHDIDLALWISGARARRVSAQDRGGSDALPHLIWAQVEADDGSVWSLRTSWLLPEGAQSTDRLEVYGSQGMAALDLAPTVTVFGDGAGPVDHELTPEAQPGAIDAEIADFCACVRAGHESDVVTLADAAHGIKLAEAVMESASRGGDQIAVAE